MRITTTGISQRIFFPMVVTSCPFLLERLSHAEGNVNRFLSYLELRYHVFFITAKTAVVNAAAN
ncbi:MAG: hypothetical protein A2162_06255 [Deltaproteobacteria bacterium RBG_13_52_11b]|nr:MAG: hypothetical protein A2162_06255 [Deltaproteobacteria bacterium RBG_13_52_11b]